MKIRTAELFVFGGVAAALLGAAYWEYFVYGLPALPVGQPVNAETAIRPFGFPGWVRALHFLNFLCLSLLVRSGLQILMDHPRLYWNIHCTPGSEWLRFTSVKVPTDIYYTSKGDARYLSPWLGIPGGTHSIGPARHWHFLNVIAWVGGGAVFVLLLFSTDQWKRLVPVSWEIFPRAWAVFVYYATFHMPPETNGFYQYNALQQLTYFGAVFVLAPLAIVTGPFMSPAFMNRFNWMPHFPLNRQMGRSVHFLALCALLFFFVSHVVLIAITGLKRNMNAIVFGEDSLSGRGLALGLGGIALVILANYLANAWSRKHPRGLQHAARCIVDPVQRLLLDKYPPAAEYSRSDISPYFWANGPLPVSKEWRKLADRSFATYRLRVHGLVETPVSLSLEDLRRMKKERRITLHHCVQGWSGIAEWGGLPMTELAALVRPKLQAKAVVFYSFGEGNEGGQYYDSHSLRNALNAQTLLAYEMNYEPLTIPHGAPLRLRVENQLGYKMVKWISAIEFVDTVKRVYKGEGGFDADNEYFMDLADI